MSDMAAHQRLHSLLIAWLALAAIAVLGTDVASALMMAPGESPRVHVLANHLCRFLPGKAAANSIKP